MQVGSTVEYIGRELIIENAFGGVTIIAPKNNTPYTIRLIRDGIDDKPVVYLNEHVCGYMPSGGEIGIKFQFIRELLPPIENIEAYINENTVAPVQIPELV